MAQSRENWETVQAEIAKRWVCLDLQDIEDCKKDLGKLPEKIQRAYEWDFEDAMEDYQRFCDFVLKSIGVDACGGSFDEDNEEIPTNNRFFNGTIEKNYFPFC